MVHRSTEFVSDSEVLYLEKNKAISLLRTIGFHSPIELNETDFIGRISYQNQYVNINGNFFLMPFFCLFSDVVKAKLSDRDSEGNKLTKAQQEYSLNDPPKMVHRSTNERKSVP